MKKSFLILFWFLVIVVFYFLLYLTNKNNSLAGLQITTNHEASVYLNNKLIGETPLIKKDLKTGKAVVTLKPKDVSFQDHSFITNLTANIIAVANWNFGKTEQESSGYIYEVKKITDKAPQVEVISIPENTIFNLNYKNNSIYENINPSLLTDLDQGEYSYSVSMPNYKTLQAGFKLKNKQKLIINVKLAKNEIKESEKAKEASSSGQLEQKLNSTDEAELTKTLKIKSTNYFKDNKEILNVRQNPNTTSKIIGYLATDQIVKYLGKKENGFYYIELDEQQNGWISQKYALFN